MLFAAASISPASLRVSVVRCKQQHSPVSKASAGNHHNTVAQPQLRSLRLNNPFVIGANKKAARQPLLAASSVASAASSAASASASASASARLASAYASSSSAASASASASAAIPQLAAKAKAVAAVVAPAAPAVTTMAILGTSLAFPALWLFALVPCMLGLINPVYVFSVGYGLSVAAQGAGLLALAMQSGVWIPAMCLAHLGGAVFYGLRLGAFLYWRSVTWAEWGKRAQNAPEAKAKGIVSRVAVIAACALLYAFMCCPMLFHVQSANAIPAALRPVIAGGLAVQWLGAIIEAVADHQKSAFKFSAEGKSRWCDVGLYARCRHPNYLGEVMFWVGTFLAGIPAMLVTGWYSFVPSTLGLAFIVYLMTSQCKKQDEKQGGRYGEQAEYAAWVGRSGSLMPKLL
eukprot:CAMPEP_0197614012 /NCGR_PEP_ID=MMETSP1326-20131121/59310_1 /TAXON_ID=1155430 /ORGANISM="Genus nov. species nov., Strain RCC2288" /LENGTH=404 /DNA_ID=CAMNT_0043182881 /DNA_START=511 /DNA_END=1726 /DNA_ORIENTATION=-